MFKKTIIAITIVFIIAVVSPFWRPQVAEHIVAYIMIRSDASNQSSELQQSITSRTLSPTSSISPSIQSSFKSFAFDIPTEFSNVKESSNGFVYTLSETDKSKSIMVLNGFSLDSLTHQIGNEEKELITGINNFEKYRSILMVVPNNISWFDTPTQAKKNILLMTLKQIKLASSPGGSYEFKNKENIQGLEIRGQLTEVDMFDDADNSIKFVFKGMDQSEIDRILESVTSKI